MRSLAVYIALLSLSTCAFGSGWVGQQVVNRPRGDTASGVPTVATDQIGHPWVAWNSDPGDTTQYWTRWLGNQWQPQMGTSRNAPGVKSRCRPDLAFGGQCGAWLVWNDLYENDNNAIAACCWNGSQWSAEQPVSPPDSNSTDVYFAPKVSCGGGQVWCVWYGGPSTSLPYAVHASRWDSLSGSWGAETRVSPPDGNHHWWCDVAVDSTGTPHVVWCTHPLFTVFYSYFDGQAWATPTPVNDTTQFTASPWASPHIVIDRTGVMHLCFTGAKVGAQHRDIVYAKDDGSGWMPCQMVTRDSLYDEWYSDIAADRPDNVWVTWDRQNEGTDQFRVYASHWDGTAWSSEQRLDDTTAYHDMGPVICLDSSGCPWVFWTGMPNSWPTDNENVYYNRFAVVGLAETQAAVNVSETKLTCPSPQHGSGLTARLDVVAATARVRLAVYDETGRCRAVLADGFLLKGTHAIQSSTALPPGVYLCRLETGGTSETGKVILLGQ
jgi:hypothetical protein